MVDETKDGIGENRARRRASEVFNTPSRYVGGDELVTKEEQRDDERKRRVNVTKDFLPRRDDDRRFGGRERGGDFEIRGRRRRRRGFERMSLPLIDTSEEDIACDFGRRV